MKRTNAITKFLNSKRRLLPYLIVFTMGFVAYQYIKYLPGPDITANTTVTFYDVDGAPFLEQTFPRRQHWVPLDEVSPYVIAGFIATEDRNFEHHFGFDIPRIARSVMVNLMSGQRAQGGSTITQQYARNIFQSFEKTWQRKAKEAYYTLRLESSYDKQTILEGYLNSINFGHGNYGIADAALFYFGKSASDLTLAEASILVGIPKGPSYYSPINNPENNASRQKIVLKSMLHEEFITEEQFDQALNSNPVIIGEAPPSTLEAPYFIDSVITELDRLLEGSKMSYGHLHVHTTLDRSIQRHVNQAIKDTVTDEEVQTAVIVIEPETGNVLALSGGNDYETSQYNRALYSDRQIGSLMKPFLYYAALEYGFNPSTTFINQPTTFIYNDGQDQYRPNNYSSRYATGEISMANALAVSDNIFAVKTHTFLGMSVLPGITSRLGITSEIPDIPSAALGVTSINIMEMAEAYAVFANQGRSVEHRFITKIEDERGFLVYTQALPENEQILDPTRTFILNSMMTGMFDKRHNNHLAVTGLSILPDLTHRYGGKSGSTNTDSWMIGYTPELVTTVWTGYDQGRELDGVEVNRYAKSIWAQVMENSLPEQSTWFEAPDTVIPVSIHPFDGSIATDNCKDAITLYFEHANLPTVTCSQFDTESAGH